MYRGFFSISSKADFISYFTPETGLVLNPSDFKNSRPSVCVSGCSPSIRCILKTKMSSFLWAVILLSCCLSEPAAALRGFANSGSSSVSRCSFNALKRQQA